MPGTTKKKKDDRPKIITTKIKEFLQYTFNPDEINKLGRDVAHNLQRADIEIENKKMADAQFKDKIERHQGDARQAARLLNAGFEMRDIDCSKVVDYVKKSVTITRIDTGEIVAEREIQDHERQMKLPESQDKKQADANSSED